MILQSGGFSYFEMKSRHESEQANLQHKINISNNPGANISFATDNATANQTITNNESQLELVELLLSHMREFEMQNKQEIIEELETIANLIKQGKASSAKGLWSAVQSSLSKLLSIATTASKLTQFFN